MFTGLVEAKGTVIKNELCLTGRRLVIAAELKDLQVGESIAVNGVCLTLLGPVDNCLTTQSTPTFRGLSAESMDTADKPRDVESGSNCKQTLTESKTEALVFDISEETLAKTQLGQLALDQKVNLERAMQLGDRFGGHVVTGHVDRTVQIEGREFQGDYLWLKLGPFADEELPFMVSKGSITVNGVSLTINAQTRSSIELLLIPHTLMATQLGEHQIGERVNIEFDYFSRLIVRHLQQMPSILNKEVCV